MCPISVTLTQKLGIGRNDFVFGVTKLRNEIYVLSQERSSASHLNVGLICVFEDRDPFNLQREIKITEISHPNDIGVSEKENCLYVCDSQEICVWRITREADGEHKIINWLTIDYQPYALSVSNDGQLLIVNNSPSILMIYGSDAQRNEFIKLPRDIKPRHAVKTSTGNFVILYEWTENEDEKESGSSVREQKWGISEFTGEGKQIVCSYLPSNDTETLHDPWYLSLDSYNQVFVMDTGNERVILLHSNLKWNQILCSTKEEEETQVPGPWTLYYDEGKKHLFVGGEGVKVYSFSR